MTETNDHILAHIADGVMTIRMNRPDKKNAITGDMYARMASALDEDVAAATQSVESDPRNLRVRLRGDWSDTGPSAVPENEANFSEL